jgi:hypothetical protein
MSATKAQRAAEVRRFLREEPVVGAVDHLGYVVCNACAAGSHAAKPIRYGATYSSGPCERCGKALISPQQITDQA